MTTFARRTSRNRLTLPKAVADRILGVDDFEVAEEGARDRREGEVGSTADFAYSLDLPHCSGMPALTRYLAPQVEADLDDAPIDKGLRYLHSKFRSAEAWQISFDGKKDYQSPEGIRVAPAVRFLQRLV